MTVAKAENNEQLYENLQWIFKYYLETTLFSPKISFNEFETDFSNYIEESTKDYLTKGYTDFLFCYSDSGNFSVYFDSKKHNVQYVCETIERIFTTDCRS